MGESVTLGRKPLFFFVPLDKANHCDIIALVTRSCPNWDSHERGKLARLRCPALRHTLFDNHKATECLGMHGIIWLIASDNVWPKSFRIRTYRSS